MQSNSQNITGAGVRDDEDFFEKSFGLGMWNNECSLRIEEMERRITEGSLEDRERRTSEIIIRYLKEAASGETTVEQLKAQDRRENTFGG